MLSKQQIKNINKLLQKQIVQKFGVVAVALLVVGSVAFFGIQQNKASQAATLGVLSTSPVSGNLTVGSNVSVTLYENSGTDSVNAVQTSVTYDATKLQYVSIAEATAFPTVAATSTGTSGIIRLARGTVSGEEVTGTNAIATITFKVLASSGTANVAYDPAFSYIVRSTDNANILTANTGSSFTLRLPQPTISSVSPASGSTAGGTAVTLTGTNFVSGTTVEVSGGTSGATNVVVTSATSITATMPARSAGVYDINVRTPDGQNAVTAAKYTYVAPDPTLSSVSPVTATTAGGTMITISGTNLTTPTSVTVGGTAATSVALVSATQITAIVPAHAAGLVGITVNFASGSLSLANAFTYTVPAPTVSAVSPNNGLISGGNTLTLTGTNFVNVSGVTIGGTAATNITMGSSTSLMTVTAPAHAAGTVSVVVTTATGSSTLANSYTYKNPAPTVSSVSPAMGTSNGGTVVTISGSNFMSGAGVTFGGTAATNVTVVNSTTITAKAPAKAAGKADIVVTNSDGQKATFAQGFTYQALGDANNDGRVNAIDLSILISHDGQNYAQADFNGDGTVGSADLAILLGRWTW